MSLHRGTSIFPVQIGKTTDEIRGETTAGLTIAEKDIVIAGMSDGVNLDMRGGKSGHQSVRNLRKSSSG